jgi:hypothetical protein
MDTDVAPAKIVGEDDEYIGLVFGKACHDRISAQADN